MDFRQFLRRLTGELTLLECARVFDARVMEIPGHRKGNTMNQLVAMGDSATINPSQADNTIRALILDDDSFDRKRIGRMVKGLGGNLVVDDADSLLRLRNRLDEHEYDLILIDYRLPVGDGLEALAMIKAHSINSDVATVMVAGDAKVDVAVSALKSGCDDFVTKNALSVEALRDVVFNALKRAQDKQGQSLGVDLKSATIDILNGISDACFDEMRPTLARMLRQIRFLKGSASSEDENHGQVLREIEASCMNLWSFLREMDEYRASWDRDNQPIQ